MAAKSLSCVLIEQSGMEFIGGLHFLKDADACNSKIKSHQKRLIFHPSNLLSASGERAAVPLRHPVFFGTWMLKSLHRRGGQATEIPPPRRTVKDLLLSSAQHPMASSVCQRTWRSV